MKMQLTPEELDFLSELLCRYERELRADAEQTRNLAAAEELSHEYGMADRLLNRLRALDLVEKVAERDYR